MVVAKYPTTTPFFLLGSCCFFIVFYVVFCWFFIPSLNISFFPNELSLNFCQDFLGFLCIFFQKDDIPLKAQQPTPWNLCCLMRGGSVLFIMRWGGFSAFNHEEVVQHSPNQKVLSHLSFCFRVFFVSFSFQ